jgi:hypothetical protein
MKQLHIVKTIQEENETTGRILLHRIYLSMQPLEEMDIEDKLNIVKTIHNSIEDNMYEQHQDFYLSMWETIDKINKTHGSIKGEREEFTKLLNEITNVLKIRTKGNTNESVNN